MSQSYVRHRTGNMAYQCSVCKRRFAWPGDVTRHKTVKHVNSKEKRVPKIEAGPPRKLTRRPKAVEQRLESLGKAIYKEIRHLAKLQESKLKKTKETPKDVTKRQPIKNAKTSIKSKKSRGEKSKEVKNLNERIAKSKEVKNLNARIVKSKEVKNPRGRKPKSNPEKTKQ